MDDKKLISALNAIGKKCFVAFFHYFNDFSYSNAEIARMIKKDRSYTLKSCNSRTSKARTIIKNNRAQDALEIIVAADKAESQCKLNARKLLNGMTINKPKAIIRRKYGNTSTMNPINNTSHIKKIPSFKFPDLSTAVQKEIALILGQICHHLHPTIVTYISESNIHYKPKFRKICHPSCNLQAFFYKNSDCVFPGFRRPINKEKGERWKNNVYEKDGTILNDNTFPRHIWAYLSEDKAYSGGSNGMWSQSGLDNFELAHIFSHKKDERNLESKVFKTFEKESTPYGFFTSASNVVLIPKGFAKPTDHLEAVEVCFYKRHLDLYGYNLIGLRNFDESYLPSWYSEIEWLDPILPDCWKEKIDNLLNYREKYLHNKYSK